MNDPHVEALSYDFVVLTEGHDYAMAAPWRGRLGIFDCELREGTLTARPSEDFVDAASARAVIEPLLDAWEARVQLVHGVVIELRYASSHVVDRQPEPGHHIVAVEGVVHTRGIASATVTVTHGEFPAPPRGVKRETETARSFRSRLHDLRTGKHRLLDAAYWYVRKLDDVYDRKPHTKLKISKNVFEEVTRIANIDDPEESRKPGGGGEKRSLEPHERSFLAKALPAIAVRVADIEGGVDADHLPQVSLEDLR